MSNYPKRLIEIDLPIKKISAHARREKSIRHGHISTLHIWWARRPLAACRAVLCAVLWPDPADPLCPQKYRDDACRLINEFAANAVSNKALAQGCSHDTWKEWQALSKVDGGLNSRSEAHWNVLRFALLDFIADFANWDNASVPEYLETARSLTQSAHEALGGSIGTHPLVIDPFAGGGSIPLEALRVGADVFASDLNPIPVLLNKVVLEYIPRYGQRLADAVRKWGYWMKKEAAREFASFYPQGSDGSTPMAYLWARTIRCEGPGCGAELPLIRSLWLAKKSNRSIALQLVPKPSSKLVDFKIITKYPDGWSDDAHPTTKFPRPNLEGTVKRGSVTCPCCGYTTPVSRVREQLKIRHGGANDARLMCVVSSKENEQGRFYRLPTDQDFAAIKKVKAELKRRAEANIEPFSPVPDEEISFNEIRRISVPLYGMTQWGDLFTERQALAISTLVGLVHGAAKEISKVDADPRFAAAVQTCLALAVSRQADYTSSLCSWHTTGEKVNHTFGRQAIPMFWDFTEVFPLSQKSGDFGGALEWVSLVCDQQSHIASSEGHIEQASATAHPLPEDSVDALVTDPPYYDSVPYAYLSDFFYVWLRRMLYQIHPDMFRASEVPKESEIVVDRPHELSKSNKDVSFYERELAKAFSEARRVVRPNGIGAIVFASKTTSSWEAILNAVVDAGWIITGSWPIDTEMEARIAAAGQARLASSVHLVCRPRKNPDGAIREDDIGDWRDILQQLPKRIHEWMPRLALEGVVGADAIFSCLGPALEIFSRYAKVEKPNGEQVLLKEYLEYVWGAVSKEAISMIFAGADTTGFEEDARLTAMWLWTLSSNSTHGEIAHSEAPEEDDHDSETRSSQDGSLSSFTLEFDAARKIAQGLGAHLERLVNLVEIKGETARLLPVVERTKALFGKGGTDSPAMKRKSSAQLSLPGLLEELEKEESGWTLQNAAKPGSTTLDRLHQAMILFAVGRGEGLRRFLVDDGVGKDQKFWSLAQSLCALYPSGTDERRWSEGVLARKKGLGL